MTRQATSISAEPAAPVPVAFAHDTLTEAATEPAASAFDVSVKGQALAETAVVPVPPSAQIPVPSADEAPGPVPPAALQAPLSQLAEAGRIDEDRRLTAATVDPSSSSERAVEQVAPEAEEALPPACEPASDTMPDLSAAAPVPNAASAPVLASRMQAQAQTRSSADELPDATPVKRPLDKRLLIGAAAAVLAAATVAVWVSRHPVTTSPVREPVPARVPAVVAPSAAPAVTAPKQPPAAAARRAVADGPTPAATPSAQPVVEQVAASAAPAQSSTAAALPAPAPAPTKRHLPSKSAATPTGSAHDAAADRAKLEQLNRMLDDKLK